MTFNKRTYRSTHYDSMYWIGEESENNSYSMSSQKLKSWEKDATSEDQEKKCKIITATDPFSSKLDMCS